ncbi:MAG: protoporphyrinogen oxidase [Gemmataceae bacterium]|nr:protoporphyrinogen oxidase [Gemmataceae bacterium]MCI0741194.1 protoporphyrinogen oxidase [Gemmataceae bacterium]
MRAVIVGAGISGLSVAFRLQQLVPQAQITILESDSRPGGTAWTLREDGFTLEIGPNGFLDSKAFTLQLAKEVGLESRLQAASEAASKNRFLFHRNKLQVLPSGLASLLFSPLLSWRGKLSLFLERFRGKNPLPDGRDSDGEIDESIDAFTRRHTSSEFAEVFADALVTGIFAGDPKRLSLRSCFPRLAELERTHGSVLKGLAQAAKERRQQAKERGERPRRGSQLWSVRDGLRTLVETLSEQLRNPPVFGVGVRRIEKTESEWFVLGDGAKTWPADVVVLTCPAHRQAAMVGDLDQSLADEIAAIPYNRVVVVGLGYRQQDLSRPLDGFGYIASQSTRRDLLGAQWCSSIFPNRAPPGAALIRALAGGWQRPEIADWDDEELLQAARVELRQTMGIAAAPIYQRIIRWPRAIPQYHVGHLARLQHIERHLEKQPGLYLGGNAYRGVALNDCTEQGMLLARRIADECVRRKQ